MAYWVTIKDEKDNTKYLNHTLKGKTSFSIDESFAEVFDRQEDAHNAARAHGLSDYKVEPEQDYVYYIRLDEGFYLQFMEESTDKGYVACFFENMAMKFASRTSADQFALDHNIFNYQLSRRSIQATKKLRLSVE